jgi:O-antigen/teichoic acid export membrane protein
VNKFLQKAQARLAAALPREFLRAGSWSFVDQAIVSGTNFVVMVTAARQLGPADFGIFALLITVLTFMEATQRSLITTPHNVLGVNRVAAEYGKYTSSVAMAQIAMASAFASVSVAAALVFLSFDTQAGIMLLAMALAAFAWQVQEFTRRVLYTENRVPAAVAGDGTAYLGRIGMTFGLVAAGWFSGPALMFVYGLSWLLGALVGAWNIRSALERSFDLKVVKEHWEFGRWLFASNTVSHLPGYVVAALLSSVLSVSAYGAFRAFEQLANSTNVPLSALSNVLRPRMSREAKNGPAAVLRMMVPIMILGGTILILFAVIYIAFREPLVRLVYGTDYVAFTSAVVLVALRPFLTLQKSLLTKALQAFRNTRAVFLGTTIGVIVGIVSGSASIVLFGLPAAGAIVIVSSVVTIIFFAYAWRRILADEVRWKSNPARTSPVTNQD